MRQRFLRIMLCGAILAACSEPPHSSTDLVGAADAALPGAQDMAPACGELGLCTPCTRNFHCPGSACDDDGSCHDLSRVAVVDNSPGCKTDGAPYCKIADAIFDKERRATQDVILVKQTGMPYETTTLIPLDHTVRIVGERHHARDSAVPVVTSRFKIVYVSGSKNAVGIEDLRINGKSATGVSSAVQCSGDLEGHLRPEVKLRYVQIDGFPSDGFTATQCESVRLVGNVIVGNGGGVSVIWDPTSLTAPGTVTLIDNVVAHNPAVAGGMAHRGVYLWNPGSGSLLAFNTLWGNGCLRQSEGCNLHCRQGANVSVVHSLIGGADQSGFRGLAGDCAVTGSAVPADSPTPGNPLVITTASGPNPGDQVHPIFVDLAGHDFHLAAPAAGMPQSDNAKLRQPSLLGINPTDADGDRRPQPGGTVGGVTVRAGVDIGADQLAP